MKDPPQLWDENQTTAAEKKEKNDSARFLRENGSQTIHMKCPDRSW
jgi:hypothetical protein